MYSGNACLGGVPASWGLSVRQFPRLEPFITDRSAAPTNQPLFPVPSAATIAAQAQT